MLTIWFEHALFLTDILIGMFDIEIKYYIILLYHIILYYNIYYHILLLYHYNIETNPAPKLSKAASI